MKILLVLFELKIINFTFITKSSEHFQKQFIIQLLNACACDVIWDVRHIFSKNIFLPYFIACRIRLNCLKQLQMNASNVKENHQHHNFPFHANNIFLYYMIITRVSLVSKIPDFENTKIKSWRQKLHQECSMWTIVWNFETSSVW